MTIKRKSVVKTVWKESEDTLRGVTSDLVQAIEKMLARTPTTVSLSQDKEAAARLDERTRIIAMLTRYSLDVEEHEVSVWTARQIIQRIQELKHMGPAGEPIDPTVRSPVPFNPDSIVWKAHPLDRVAWFAAQDALAGIP